MSDHETKQEVIAKIRKLLALANSSNIHEAELAAERASKLMEKWRISAAAVQEVEEIRSGRDGIASFEFTVPNCKMKLKWVETLGLACAVLFDGTILVNGRLHGTSWVWVGFRSEVPLMEALFLHLWASYASIADHDLKLAKAQQQEVFNLRCVALGIERGTLMGPSFTPAQTMKFKHGHGQGFAMSLYTRCLKLAADRKKAVVASTSTALVLVRDGALQEWKERSGVRNVKQKQTKGSSEGFNSGYQRGQSIPLGGALK